MKLDFTMTKAPAQDCLLWELHAEDGKTGCIYTNSGERLNKHQIENLAFVSVAQLRKEALYLLTQTAARIGIDKLALRASDIVRDVLYQNLGMPWEPADEYDTPPTYDPHWAKKIPHGKDI